MSVHRTTGLFLRLRVIGLEFDRISCVCIDVVKFDQVNDVEAVLLAYQFPNSGGNPC